MGFVGANNADAPMKGRCMRVSRPDCDQVVVAPVAHIILGISNPRVNTPIALMPSVLTKAVKAETGLTHRKRLFRVKLTPCCPVVVELARSRTGREPKYLGGRYHEGKGSSSARRLYATP